MGGFKGWRGVGGLRRGGVSRVWGVVGVRKGFRGFGGGWGAEEGVSGVWGGFRRGLGVVGVLGSVGGLEVGGWLWMMGGTGGIWGHGGELGG